MDRLQTPTADTRQGSAATLARGGDRAMLRAGLVALSDERDLALRLRLAAWREGYQRGREDGWREGQQASERDLAASWREVASRVARGRNDPTYADLERRRWGPGGREHFGDPRPSDYPGRAAGW